MAVQISPLKNGSDARRLDHRADLLDAAIASARQTVEDALTHAVRPILSTNLRPGAVGLLHLVYTVHPRVPVVWVDTGYNTPATYRYAQTVEAELGLELIVYTPRMTPARWSATFGPIPRPGDTTFDAFVETAKLDPFRRALDELNPDLWLTGIRREQTPYRESLSTRTRGPRGVARVAPLIEWNAALVDAYIGRYALPDNDDYADPTKPGDRLECGLQQIA